MDFGFVVKQGLRINSYTLTPCIQESNLKYFLIVSLVYFSKTHSTIPELHRGSVGSCFLELSQF